MALAVIGSLVFSTLLTLVFVPAMFMMMDDIGGLSWRPHSQRSSSAKADDPVTTDVSDRSRSRGVLDAPLSRGMTINKSSDAALPSRRLRGEVGD
jgi:hypothetical protein